MKPILTCALAATMALTAQSVYAERDRGGDGRAAVSRAPAAAARPSVARQAPMQSAAPRAAVRSQAIAPQRSATVASSPRIRSGQNITRTPERTAVASGTRAGTREFTPSTTTARTRTGRFDNNSVAFGGRTNRAEVRSRDFYRPPVDVYRDWDHGRTYSWHNHRYHWYDGAWVALDVGPDYGYDYDTVPTVAVESSVNSDLVAQVQAALDKRGYDAGPVDGVPGAQTRDAISAFQDDHGLAVNGQITNGLLRRLGL